MAATTEQQKTSNNPSGAKGSGRGRGGGRGGRGSGRGRGRGRGGRGGRGQPRPQQQQQQQAEKDNNNNNKKDKKQESSSSTATATQRKSKQGKQNKGKNDNRNKPKQQQQQQQQQQQGKNKGGKGSSMSSNSGSKSKTNTPHAPSIPPSQPQQTSDINYGRGQSITVLHIAEKPSIAQAIANGLCRDNNSKTKSSRGKSLPVHEFKNPPFPKAPHASECKHRVTSVAGHVFSVDFPQQFQSWDAVDPAELFDAPVVRKPCKGSVVNHLKDEARNVDFIVLWMDCDREGENINFEVLDCCMHLMKSSSSGGGNYDRVYRAHFSAINPSDIQKAYQALGKPDKNQSLSVDARQELDLKVGVAFSRFQTRYFQGRYGDLDSAVLSYGPCQTPTLGFCVQRHIDIETFKPEPYWVLELGIIKRGRALKALWNSGRSFQKNKVENLKETALETDPVIVRVENVVSKEKKQGRPVPLNTVGLLKACSKALGIGPHSAMKIAESLYLSGYLSYPRTESTAYPKSFDIYGTLSEQANDGRWGTYVRNLLQEGHNKARGGVDMGDHPPICPMRVGHGLSGDMGRVYEFVVRHFIASVSKDAVWSSTRVDFAIDTLGEKGHFTLRGKELVSPGFLEVLLHREYGDEKRDGDDDEDEEERTIPEFTKGEIIPLTNSKSTSNSTKIAVASSESCRASLDIKEKMTTPPTYLTESELISLMEKHGIGTDASISTHIEVSTTGFGCFRVFDNAPCLLTHVCFISEYFETKLCFPRVRT